MRLGHFAHNVSFPFKQFLIHRYTIWLGKGWNVCQRRKEKERKHMFMNMMTWKTWWIDASIYFSLSKYFLLLMSYWFTYTFMITITSNRVQVLQILNLWRVDWRSTGSKKGSSKKACNAKHENDFSSNWLYYSHFGRLVVEQLPPPHVHSISNSETWLLISPACFPL